MGKKITTCCWSPVSFQNEAGTRGVLHSILELGNSLWGLVAQKRRGEELLIDGIFFWEGQKRLNTDSLGINIVGLNCEIMVISNDHHVCFCFCKTSYFCVACGLCVLFDVCHVYIIPNGSTSIVLMPCLRAKWFCWLGERSPMPSGSHPSIENDSRWRILMYIVRYWEINIYIYSVYIFLYNVNTPPGILL